MNRAPGVTARNGGIDIVVASAHATQLHVCLYEGEGETRRVPLTKHGDTHHAFVPDVAIGTRYGLRAEGPWDPDKGLLFDPSKLLVDPSATRLDRPFAYAPALSQRGHDTAALVPKAIVEVTARAPARHAPHRPTWIYELPVRAFTMRHPDIPDALRGTIAALAHPACLAHFKALGVDTIELMPLAAWIDERHLAALGLHNAWGYNPVTLMAPDPRLAPGGFAEIASTIATLHAHGLQVILDVVLNHSGESDVFGPTLSFRGLDNPTYYRHYDGKLGNDAGCGNMLALDHPIVCAYALQALCCWVERTGLDGFRFDLATVMGRRPDGFDAHAPLLAAITTDPVLKDLILIAEPWDIGPGGYQLGNFPKPWLEWNDRYRDDTRRFWRGDHHASNAMATRLTGSSDLFGRKSPARSVNFLAAHDGFTLADVTRFTYKNNFANGEDNRDGKSDEATWPNGNVAALLATLFLSRGTPMLTAGDEFGRSQNGNNNAYAQDNDTTWLQWQQMDKALLVLTAELVRLRAAHPLLHADAFLTGQGLPPDAEWFDASGNAPDWSSAHNRVLGLRLNGQGQRLAIVLNGSDPCAFPLPDSGWQRIFTSSPGAECPPSSVTVWQFKLA
jgi:glycogen debranching enzyme